MAFDAIIKDYLKEIDEAPLLNWEQEQELATRIIEDDDPIAREQMVCSNLRLVVKIAKGFSSRNHTLGDLIEEGNLGLLRAVDSFDPDYGVRFSTYASWWIKQGIKRAMLTNTQPIHIPTYMVELINQWRYAERKLSNELGRDVEMEEVAASLKLPMRKARAVKQIVDTVAAGFHGDSSDSNAGLDETIQDEKILLPEEILGSDEELAKAVKLLGQIEPREAEVLTLRFGLNGQQPLTLKEIGVKLDLTRERVRQIQRSGLEKLNELMLEE